MARVYMESVSLKKEFATFSSYKDAVAFCEEHKWIWKDENSFEWDLSLDEEDRVDETLNAKRAELEAMEMKADAYQGAKREYTAAVKRLASLSELFGSRISSVMQDEPTLIAAREDVARKWKAMKDVGYDVEAHNALKREIVDLSKNFQMDETGDSSCDGCGSCKDGCSCSHDEEPEECPQVAELCPYCEHEVYLNWDVEEDGYQIFCPHCGNAIMLCSMCDARDGAPCDWNEETGCKHSRPGYGKQMNPWTLISDHRPNEDTPILVKQDFRFGPVTIGRMKKTAYGSYIWECMIVSEGRSLLLETLAIAGKFSWPDMEGQEGSMMYLGDKYIQGWIPIQKED